MKISKGPKRKRIYNSDCKETRLTLVYSNYERSFVICFGILILLCFCLFLRYQFILLISADPDISTNYCNTKPVNYFKKP